MSLRSINTIWGSTHTRYTGLAEMGCWDVWCNDYTPYIGMFLSLSTSVRGWSLFVMWWGRCVGWHPMRRGCSSCSKFRETRGRSSLQRRGYVTWLWYGANHVHWPTDLVSCPRQVDHMHQLEHPPANCWCNSDTLCWLATRICEKCHYEIVAWIGIVWSHDGVNPVTWQEQ